MYRGWFVCPLSPPSFSCWLHPLLMSIYLNLPECLCETCLLVVVTISWPSVPLHLECKPSMLFPTWASAGNKGLVIIISLVTYKSLMWEMLSEYLLNVTEWKFLPFLLKCVSYKKLYMFNIENMFMIKISRSWEGSVNCYPNSKDYSIRCH